MGKTSENVYSLLVARSFHDRMEDCEVPCNVVGGLGLHAVTNAAEIDWDNHVVYLSGGVCYRVYVKMVRCETLIH